MYSKLVAYAVAALWLFRCSALMASIQLNIGDTVAATLSASASIMGTGATTLSLYDNSNQLEETWNSNQGGLLGWTNVSVNGQPAQNFKTSCIEVLQNVYWGGAATWTIADLATCPKPNALNDLTGGMGSSIADLIQALYDKHYEDAEAGSLNAGAFQIAIWKLVYDGVTVVDGANFSTGRLRATTTDEVLLATDWLYKLTGNTHSKSVALTSGDFQDQFYSGSAPEPSSGMMWAALASVSLGLCMTSRRR